MTILRKIADVLAVVFHPVFLFFYVFLLVTSPFLHNYWVWLITILAGTIIAPIIMATASGDIYLSKKEKRYMPMFLICVSYISTYLVLQKFQTWYPLSNDIETWMRRIKEYHLESVDITVTTWSMIALENLLAVTFGLVALAIGNFWKKFSLHAGGYGFIIVFLVQPFSGLISCIDNSIVSPLTGIITGLIFCAVIPLVLWQRIKSGAHTPLEVAAGLVIGILTSALVKFSPAYYWLMSLS